MANNPHLSKFILHLLMLAEKYKYSFIVKTIKYTLIALLVGIIGFISLTHYYFPRNSVILPKGDGMGLGNQLFRYAAAYSLAKTTGKKLYLIIDPSEPIENTKVTDRNNVLGQFHLAKESFIHENFLSRSLLRLFKSPIFYNNKWLNKIFPVYHITENNFMPLSKEKNNSTFIINGYFESEIFFADYKDDIRKMFTTERFKSSKIDNFLSQVTAQNSVCIHVRRRDFAEGKHMTIKYQQKAMLLAKELLKDPHFYVFSDDIEQAKEELGEAPDLTYVSNDNLLPIDDFVLLSNCTNNINANSTFSWWASYLNKKDDRLVIDPYPRMNDYSLNKIPCDSNCMYAWKSLIHGFSAPSNWVLLAYEQRALNDAMLGIIPSPKYEELFKNYKPLPFYIYSGELAQLTLCKNGDFRQGLCFLNGASSKKPTVVTAYYQVPNKHSHQKYLHWAQNFLSIPFDLVVFTDKKNAGWIKKARGNLPLVVAEKEFDELYHNKFSKIYNRNLKQDIYNRSPELYTIWAEKVKFVNEAIDLNPYQADYFVWCDIGTVRRTRYIDHNFPNAKFMNKERITFSLFVDFTEAERANKFVDDPKDIAHVQGNIQVGDILAWRVYNQLWDITRDHMMENGLSTADDQRVMSTIALRYPNFVNLLYTDPRFQGNPWWYPLLYYANSTNLLKMVDVNYYRDEYDIVGIEGTISFSNKKDKAGNSK